MGVRTYWPRWCSTVPRDLISISRWTGNRQYPDISLLFLYSLPERNQHFPLWEVCQGDCPCCHLWCPLLISQTRGAASTLGEVRGAAKPPDHQLHLCGAHVVEAEVFSDGVNGFARSLCPAGTVSHAGHTATRGQLQSPGHSCKAYRRICYASATE